MKKIPLHSLVIMVGPAGSGKTNLIAQHFPSYEVVSADDIRYEITGDTTRLDINDTVFREVYRRMVVKLELGERVVVNATNLRKKDRVGLADIGYQHGAPVFYLVVDQPLEVKEREASQQNIPVGVIKRQHDIFLANERDIMRGDNVANVIDARCDSFEVIKKVDSENVLSDIKARGYNGILAVGDVHGMSEALKSALDWAAVRNLFIVFLGDVIDYGPDSVSCVDRIYDMVTRGKAIITMGNHERKIERWIDQTRRGDVRVRLSEGNRATTRAIEAMGADGRRRFEAKFKALLGFARHHWIIGDTLFVHGAAEPEMFETNSFRLTGKHETMALFGEVDNTTSREDGYPNRVYHWVDRIPHGKRVIVGHDIRSTTKPLEVRGSNGGVAIFMDTGSGKGGSLTTADLIFGTDNDMILKSYTRH